MLRSNVLIGRRTPIQRVPRRQRDVAAIAQPELELALRDFNQTLRDDVTRLLQ